MHKTHILVSKQEEVKKPKKESFRFNKIYKHFNNLSPQNRLILTLITLITILTVVTNYLIKSEGYEEGGTENQPIQRSIKTIATKLIIANKLPPDVVGAAIFKVFSHIAFNNLKFKGDGSYGSKGRELFTSIKNQAINFSLHFSKFII